MPGIDRLKKLLRTCSPTTARLAREAGAAEVVTVHAFESFPSAWEIVACRSSDGTPILSLDTYGGADHDADEVPYVRVYVDDVIVHDHPAPPQEGSSVR